MQLKNEKNKYYSYCFHKIAIDGIQALVLVKFLFYCFGIIIYISNLI